MFSGLANKLHDTISNTIQAHQSTDGGVTLPGGDANRGGSGGRMHALDQLTNSLRTLHTQYSPQVPPGVRPLQLVITSEKTLSLGYESVARDARAHSRDLYLWGQEQEEDVKDVTDRLAFLSFTHGALASQFSTALDEARAPLKQLRDAEQIIAPRRAARVAAQTQLAKARTERGAEKRVLELEESLARSEAEDADIEARARRALREGVREAERLKWAAVRVYADKLLLLARASEPLLELIPPVTTDTPGLPSITLAAPGPYEGAQKSANVKSAVQHAIDTYIPGALEPLPTLPPMHSLSRAASDTRSFGVTHLPEINTSVSAANAGDEATPAGLAPPPNTAISPNPPTNRFVAPLPPSATGASTSPPSAYHAAGTSPTTRNPTSPLSNPSNTITSPTSGPAPIPITSHPSNSASIPTVSSAALDPSVLNQTPAPLPPPITSASSSGSVPALSPLTGAEETRTTSGAVPTIAETGVPLAAGEGGPGPQSGSLKREALHPTPAYPTAEEEKRRLERDRLLSQSQQQQPPPVPTPSSRPLPTSTTATPAYPTAEEEKRRLERDRLLTQPATATGTAATSSSSGGRPLPITESERMAKAEKERLEREERERVLRAGTGGGAEEDLPPYAD